MRRFLLTLVAVLAVISPAAMALDVPNAPSLDRPIVDQTGTLSDVQIDQLSDQIEAERGEKNFQIGVLIITSLDGTAIEDYSIDVARTWGIGEKDKNNGVLLLVAKDDRQLRIEVGSGLEGDLTDIQSGHIISDVITPKFKQGDFYGGISDGLESIAALVQGRADPHPAPQPSIWKQLEDVSEVAIIVAQGIVFGFIWLASILARSKRWWAGGVLGGVAGLVVCLITGWAIFAIGGMVIFILVGLLFDWAVSRNYTQRKRQGRDPSWWAGGSAGSGSSGGGGGSFGGGGFSGGGASGSW